MWDFQPMYPALFGTGHDYLEIAWMPPISSCSPWGVRAYKLEITIEQGNEKVRLDVCLLCFKI